MVNLAGVSDPALGESLQLTRLACFDDYQQGTTPGRPLGRMFGAWSLFQCRSLALILLQLCSFDPRNSVPRESVSTALAE